ncbi:MAG: YceI family protein [Bacteroidales bacterium]
MNRLARIMMIDSDTNQGGSATSLSVVANQSVINWNAFKTHGEHHGTLQIKSGIVEVDENKLPVGGTIYFDMTTIDDSDLSNNIMKKELEADLKSSNFFDVEKFPEAKLEIVKVDHTPDASGTYGVNAVLTMKGIRGELTFKASYTLLPEGGIKVETGVVVVDRTKWGITYGSKNIFKKLADHIIADNFDVKAVVVAK